MNGTKSLQLLGSGKNTLLTNGRQQAKIIVENNTDSDDEGPVIIRTAENGKEYAINKETGIIEGGLGPGSNGKRLQEALSRK